MVYYEASHIEFNVLAFVFSCTIGQVHLLVLYKDEKPSVRLSVGNFFWPSVSPWFLPGSTPDMLDMKRPSLQITKNIFKRF